jgi:uncharacterized protein YgiM (DUF1202 family)
MLNRKRASWLGVMLAVTITFAGCYPFQGDISLLLTPVPVDPTRQAEILAAMNNAQSEAAATPESVAGEAEMADVTAIVSSNSLRVRQEADPNSPIVAGLRQGDSVKVVGHSEDGTWLQIQIPDVETLGWVAAEFMTVEGDVMALPVPGGDVVAEQPAAVETPAPVAEAPAAGGEMAMSALTVNVDPASLQIVDGVLTVPSITSSSAGWLVVHADDGGTFGPVIGYAALAEGENTDVAVEIDTDAATETVHLMLHEDGGVVGTYEFPGADAPVIVDGAPVSMAYAVGAPVMSDVAVAPTAAPAVAPTVAPTTALAAPAAAPTAAPAAPAASSESSMSAGEVAAMSGMSSAELAIVNTRSARVRSGPAADAEVVGGALAGDIFPVAEKSVDGKWVRIYFPGTDGEAWVGSELVDVSAVGLNVKYGNVTVNTDGPRLRVRNAPTVDGEIVGYVYNGETRYAIGVSPDGNWALLFLPAITGPTWVSAEYVTYQ